MSLSLNPLIPATRRAALANAGTHPRDLDAWEFALLLLKRAKPVGAELWRMGPGIRRDER